MNRIAEVTCLKTKKAKRIGASIALIAALTLVSTAHADERPERELPGGESVHQTERPQLDIGDEAPRFRASQFVEERSFEAQRRQDEQIVRLRQMIERTPVDNPDRAEYLYNLAEIFWVQGRGYDNSAIEMRDQCYIHDDHGEEQEARRCRFRVSDMEEEARRLREESVGLYIQIIQNYGDFDELDTVYFHLGTSLMETGRTNDALDIFRRLLAEFPQTEYVPQVWLYFGDHHFDNGDMFEALDAYRNVMNYPDSPIYGYAVYKLGWTYFNLDNYERSLEEFLRVVDIARAAPEGSTDRAMLRQVRGDIVRVYARIGSPDEAIAFFQDLAPEREDWLSMSETLAIYYGNEAQFETSNRMYRNLIGVNRQSVQVIDYQYEIVRNQTTINAYDRSAIEEIIRMMMLVQMAEQGEFEDSDSENYRRIWTRVEESSRNWALTYHREAQRTRNPQLYVMAHHLYQHYLQTYPESDQQYTMTFFHGELLFGLEEWEAAATAYERVLEIDPEGEYTEDVVLGTMLALLEIVEASEERVALEGDFDTDDEQAVPEPIEMGEMEQRFMDAAANYIRYVPDGERIVEVLYITGRNYFDHNYFEEAADRFSSIAFNHSDHDLAIVAANLHLASLDRMNDFHGLADAVERYLTERPVGDHEFNEDLRAMNDAIRFNICVLLDQEERWEEGAHCYVEYVQQFGNSEILDLALYNAALNFERIHEVNAAISVRQALLRHRPNSELRAETMYNIGGNYHAWAIYGEAARYYEQFVREFPDEEQAEGALSNAALFRHGLGQYEEAIANYERYLELFGRDNPQQGAEVVYQIAEIYEEQGRQDDAIRQYRHYLNNYADAGVPDRRLQAHLKIGLQQWEEGDRRTALNTFERILEIYRGMPEETQQQMIAGRDAASQAQFMIAENVFERAANIEIVAGDDEELAASLGEKGEATGEARAIYEQVIEFQRPDWSIASLYRIGRGTQDIAEVIRQMPLPDGLTFEQEEIMRSMLEDNASQFEASAVEMYARALEVSRRTEWFNEYSHQAEEELGQLRPQEYRRPSEIRAQPGFFSDGFMSSTFLVDVQAQDVLGSLGGGEEDAPAEEVEEEPRDGGGQAGGDDGQADEPAS